MPSLRGSHQTILSATDDPSSPWTGLVYYNTARRQVRYYDGSNWQTIPHVYETMEQQLHFANDLTRIHDFNNGFCDGFLGNGGVARTDGIDGANSSGYSTTEVGVVKPTVSDVRITGGTPSVSGGGTAANVNDNNTGTTVAWTPGNLAAAAVNSRRFATIDFGSNKTVTMIEVRQTRVSAGAPAADGLYYSTDGSNWTLLGATFAVSTTPADFQRTGPVTARYVAYVASQTNYSTITATLSDLNAYEAGTPSSIDLRSVSRAVTDTPKRIDVMALVEETEALTLNTNFLLHASRDGNNSYVQGTAVKLGTLASGLSVIVAPNILVTSQGSANNLRSKATSVGKNFKMPVWGAWARA